MNKTHTYKMISVQSIHVSWFIKLWAGKETGEV